MVWATQLKPKISERINGTFMTLIERARRNRTDLRSEGIAVGIYHPGWVQTDMGGAGADITPEAAATGLSDRFDALSIATTGCFETWDGRAHAY